MIDLFGPTAGWAGFRPVNDTVRGGASTSKLVTDRDSDTATFSGHLDISALGGAGFASQSHSFAQPVSLPTSSQLVLSFVVPPAVEPSQPTSFVITLKNDRPGRRPDGRRESVLSYEYKFDLRSWLNGDAGLVEKGRVVEVRIGWDEFVPTYRGREQKGKEVEPGHIVELSFMARSNFGQQEGDFELTLVRLSVEHTQKCKRSSWLDAVLSWLSPSCWVGWWQRWTGSGATLKRRGQIRLADEEAD